VLRRRGSGRGRGSSRPGEIYDGLRRTALDAVADGVLTPPFEGHPDVAGVVVDVPASGGYATLVALADATASLYTSTGGGTIGAGTHATVAAEVEVLLGVVQHQLDDVTGPEDTSLPPRGVVRFHVLTPAGGRTADVPEDAFWGRAEHPLMPVIAATQQVISAIRQM